MHQQTSTERQLNILVVDDDVDNAASLGELFELYGHKTKVVHSGEEAIAAYLEQTFDLAFMDVMMPGKNGVESFLEIRKLCPAAKVIMMTGFSVEQLLQQAMESGALGVLSKPMEPSRALKMLDELGPQGVLVTPTQGNSSKANMQDALAQAGKKCHVLSEKDQQPLEQPEANDVIIIDIQKPLIEGLESYAALTRSGVSAPTIIYVNAPANVSPLPDMLADVRVTGILNKPFDPDLLLKSVHHITA